MDLRSYIILCILTCNSAQLKSHCTFVTARNIYYRTPENTHTQLATINYILRARVHAHIYIPHPKAKYLIEALRKRAVSRGSDYENPDGRFARRGKREKRVRISPAAERVPGNKTLARFARRWINGPPCRHKPLAIRPRCRSQCETGRNVGRYARPPLRN